MSEQYLGEIRVMSFGFPPRGWAQCNGQLLPRAQNTALFSVIGTTYGGDGEQNFALPNLQGRTLIHQGSGLAPGNTYAPGDSGGEQSHTLQISEMPTHKHTVSVDSVLAASDGQNPAENRVLAASTGALAYGPASATDAMNPNVLGTTGDGQPHDNMSPYTVLNVCIALVGIFPPRN